MDFDGQPEKPHHCVSPIQGRRRTGGKDPALWVEVRRKKVAKGEVIVVRYADDLVVGLASTPHVRPLPQPWSIAYSWGEEYVTPSVQWRTQVGK